MNRKLFVSALSIAAMLTVAPAAMAQKKSGAENGLIGIKLYDTGVRVVSVYGTPDEVQAVGGSSTAIGPSGGGGGGAAGGGGGRPGLGVAGPGRAGFQNPGDLGDRFLLQGAAGAGENGPGSAVGGVGGPAGGGGDTGGAGGAGGVGGGSSNRILFTRWVYNRSGCKYGFVLDRSNRVVQIEAIGLSNSKVKTSKGATFGTTFAQLIKKYNAPDGYEISGDNVVVRFLVRNKVAFRLSRLGPNKPQVVTGIVVAAGKT